MSKRLFPLTARPTKAEHVDKSDRCRGSRGQNRRPGSRARETAGSALRWSGLRVALVALLGWLLGVRFLAGQWGTYFPMAPSTALAFLLLGGAIFCHARWPSGARARYTALAGAGVVALLGLLILGKYVAGYDSGIEWALARTNEMFGRFPVGRMSPLTAVSFLLQSGALMLMLALDIPRWRVAAALAVVLAVAATVIIWWCWPGMGMAFPACCTAARLFPWLCLPPWPLSCWAWDSSTRCCPEYRRSTPGSAGPPAASCCVPSSRAGVLLIILDGSGDVAFRESVQWASPGVWHALAALASGGLIVVLIGWIARRTADALQGSETALMASEVRYRRLFESAKDGILVLDAETGTIVDVNPFLVELLGFSRDSFFGKKVWDLGFFKDLIANQDAFAELNRRSTSAYTDKPLETKDGRRIDVEFVSNVYMVNDRKVIQCNVRDITERTRADAALRESDSRLPPISNMRLTECLSSMRQASIGMSTRSLHFGIPGTIAPCASQCESALGEVRASIDALRATTKIDDNQYLGFVKDITEHKTGRGGAPGEQGRLREAQRLAHIGSWHWTAASDAVVWSEEMFHIAGRDPRLPAPSFAEMSACYTPESWRRLNAGVAQALQGGESYELDLEMVLPDGTTRQTSTLGKADRDASGTIVGLFGTVQDITERTRREEEKARLLAIIDESPDFIGVADLQGNLLYHNRAARKMVGLPDDADLSAYEDQGHASGLGCEAG